MPVPTTEAHHNELIQRAMEAARELTGLKLSYVSQFLDGAQHIQGMDGDNGPFGIGLHVGYPLETTICQRMVDGRLPSLMPDTKATEVADVVAETDGAAIIGAYVGVPLRLGDGRLYGSFCCVSDVAEPWLTERHADLLRMLARLVGDQIDQRQRTDAAQRAQHEFLASVSHDLRSPLIAVANLAEDLAARHPDVEPGPAGVTIERETRRVLSMVDDMMLVSRQRAGALTISPVPVDLAALARDCAASCALAAGTDGERLMLTLPAAPLVAEVDPGRVTQALQNLIENALKYSPDGGVVEVTVEANGPTARIAVRDHGIGIAEEDQAHLGERFFRASSATEHGIGGIGLGLATTQAIAALHEGTLSTESAPGVGSTFTLRLPLQRPA